MTFSRIVAAIIVVAATLWIGSGVLGRTEPDAKATAEAATPVAPPLFQVAIVTARVEEHSRGLVLSGHTEADNRASAVARAAGSIVELKVNRGDHVKEGDIIADPLRRGARRARSQRRRRWCSSGRPISIRRCS